MPEDNNNTIDIGMFTSEKKAFHVPFAGIEFDVRMLTEAEKKQALRLSRKPGSSKKKPKHDLEKAGTEMCFKAIVGWRREGGGIVVNDGEELLYNDENKTFLIQHLPGLKAHIIEPCSSADKMHELISEDEIKN